MNEPTSQTTTVEQPPIEICFGPQCSDFGSRKLAEKLKTEGLELITGDCRSQCPHAPLVLVDNRMICQATVEKVQTRIRDAKENPEKYVW